jgi:oxygen-independent coproporphyrinogen-3 oxidase
VARGLALTEEDRLRGDVIERLMCDFSVDLEAVAARHGQDRSAFAADLQKLAALEEDGMVDLVGGRVSVTSLGRAFVRVVAQVFDRHSNVQQRFSRAV